MMSYSQKLMIKQTQGIVLTPEMRQSLSLLQMSCTELNDFLNQEMMENPLLETDDSAAPAAETDDVRTINWTAYLKSCSSRAYVRGRQDSGEEENFTFEKYAYDDMTYHEVLDMQFDLNSGGLTSRQLRIGRALLDQINEDGYLFTDLDELSAALNVDPEETEVLLELIQRFFPAGTGARSVGECLYLQLRSEGPVSEAYRILLFHHLEDLTEHRFKKIEHETGISSRTQTEFFRKIKTLHPRPGSQFAGQDKTYYVVPDGSISWKEGTLSVKLNNIGTPSLMISPFYRKMLLNENCSPQTKEYITERMNRALAILHNIEAREKTIETIVSVVAEEQKEFLLGKANALKPLTQKQIAAKTGLHESTVSRTVRGKYFLTPRGTLELKALFCNSYVQGDQAVTIDIIKQRIRVMIEQEDHAHPLTDQKIADSLSADVVSIARRTVAKYREEMGIQTSSRRRAEAR